MGTWEGLTPPYSTIVADPPWPFKWSAGAGGRRRATKVASPGPYLVELFARAPRLGWDSWGKGYEGAA